ncbi:hypothetical protein LIZ76_17115 [Caldibacillus sp. 210928-DFI.2.22]|nr:hypothetical protein [Caldibacillus sp. 210928-DFI.2.22]
MTTKPFLVTILSRKTPFLGDEAHSRRHFQPENFFFLGDEAQSRHHFQPGNPIF